SQTATTSASSTYRQVGSQGVNYSNGWLPVNFAVISAGSPLGNLPIDPTNSSSSNKFYAYTATSSNGYAFEIDANMESTKYAQGGGGNVESTDGGNRDDWYEVGTAPGLAL